MNRNARPIEALVSEVTELQHRLLTTLHHDFPDIARTIPPRWPRRVEVVIDGIAWHGTLHGMGYRFESEDGRVIEAHDRIQAAPFPIDSFRLALYAQSCGIEAITFKDVPPVGVEPEDVARLLLRLEQAGLVERDKRVDSFQPPRYLVAKSGSSE